MRIVLITGEYPPAEGGVADYTQCLAVALAAAGAAAAVVTGPVDIRGGRAGPTFPNEPRALGNEHALVPVHESTPGWGWRAMPALARQISDLRPDVVHIQYQAAAYGLHPAISFLPFWLSRLALTARIRTAITYHDLRVPYLFPKAGPLRDWVARFPAQTADAAVVTNPSDAAVLEAWGRAKRLRLIPIGSNIPDAPPDGFDRRPWRRAHGIADAAPVLAYFGFLGASKGGLTLLDGLAALRSGRFGAKLAMAELVMIGGHVGASDPTNAAYLAAFNRQIERLGLGGAVRWTGHIVPSEVSAWLHAADVVVLPYHDGASYRRGSLLAALTHGRPVVTTWPAADDPASGARRPSGFAATPLGGVPPAADPAHIPGGLPLPAIEDGKQALLVPPGDAEALARAVARVCADPSLAADLGAAARQLAARFGWPAIAAHHLALYEVLLRGGHSG